MTTQQQHVKAVAVGGRVCIELPAPMAYGTGPNGERTWASVTISPEQAGEVWNAIAEAELVALEQRVRARRQVTEGARGGWATAPAQGRHAAEVRCLVCFHLRGAHFREGCDADANLDATCGCVTYTPMASTMPVPDVGMALAESTAAALNRLASPGYLRGYRVQTDIYAPPAPEPGDPYAAPDYQHPDGEPPADVERLTEPDGETWDGPSPLEPLTPLSPKMITRDQSKRIHAGFTALGIKNREAYLAWMRRALGLDKLDTTADLSYRQAVDLLAALAARHRAEKGVTS